MISGSLLLVLRFSSWLICCHSGQPGLGRATGSTSHLTQHPWGSGLSVQGRTYSSVNSLCSNVRVILAAESTPGAS